MDSPTLMGAGIVLVADDGRSRRRFQFYRWLIRQVTSTKRTWISG